MLQENLQQQLLYLPQLLQLPQFLRELWKLTKLREQQEPWKLQQLWELWELWEVREQLELQEQRKLWDLLHQELVGGAVGAMETAVAVGATGAMGTDKSRRRHSPSYRVPMLISWGHVTRPFHGYLIKFYPPFPAKTWRFWVSKNTPFSQKHGESKY